MAIVQWGLPVLSGLCWLMWGRMRPACPLGPSNLFLAGAAAGWLWAAYAGGFSRYARAHGLLAAWVIGLLWLYPLSTALLPTLIPSGGAGLDAAFGAVHMLVLAAAGLWHRARAAAVPDTQRLHWEGVDVDLATRMVKPTDSTRSTWQPAACAAVVALVLYASLRGSLSASVQAAVAASGMHVLATWLYAGALGRVFGQALRLWQLERLRPGAPFAHAAITDMQVWRRSSWLYRFAAPRPPAP
jgi:hypothetical protein